MAPTTSNNLIPKPFFYLLDTRPIWPPSTPPEGEQSYNHEDRTRNATSTSPSAQPYLHALSEDEQAKVKRFHFHRDGKLALGSAVLKRFFVCRATNQGELGSREGGSRAVGGAKVKWREVRLGRRVTALDRRNGVEEDSERGKPCYIPPDSGAAAAAANEGVELDFNTSHQAGLVVLGGYRFDRLLSPKQAVSMGDEVEGGRARKQDPAYSLGVDVTCTSERMERDLEMIRKESAPGPGLQAHRGISKLPSGVPIRGVQPAGMRRQMETKRLQKGFEKFVDMHEEVFSKADVEAMKGALPGEHDDDGAVGKLGNLQIQHSGQRADGGADAEARTEEEGGTEDLGMKSVKALLRRFYAYWALKEAYVKMEGEALLADWLKEVEFRNVRVPRAAGGGEEATWGETNEGIEVYLRGKKRENVQMFLQAFENDYLVATAAVRREGLPAVAAPRWEHVDVKKDVLPLAEG